MESFLKEILLENSILETKTTASTISKLVDNTRIIGLANSISDTKKQILEIFNMYKQCEDFKDKHIAVDNANAKREYEYFFNMDEFPEIVITKIKNLEPTGLQFDPDKKRIYGTPPVACNADLQVVFYHKSDVNLSEDVKDIPFIVNADPKDLWKNIPSKKDTIYAKEDELTHKGLFLDKKIVVASKRGRSHAHDGTFRDDHFFVTNLPNGWAIVAVADGAGSAKYARQGSKIATEYLAETFNNEEILQNLSSLVQTFYTNQNQGVSAENTVKSNGYKSEEVDTENVKDNDLENIDEIVNMDTSEEATQSDISSEIVANSNIDITAATDAISIKEEVPTSQKTDVKSAIINILYKSVRNVFQKLEDFSSEGNMVIKDLNTTLIFALTKKFDFGYTILTFGVGDCPINILAKDEQSVNLLNFLDVGEFGGGTRFLTMKEIYSNPVMGSRFAINFYEDFSKLFLMTDGIYDPKFVTENKLEDFETWKIFLEDLAGKNEDRIKVDFSDDENIDSQLLKWMDFWSKGNHDDRTLAIIY